MKKMKADLDLVPDNGQMSLWASGVVLGDLVMTAEGDTGLVVEQSTRDLQGFVIFKILMQGKEFFYSALELAVIGV